MSADLRGVLDLLPSAPDQQLSLAVSLVEHAYKNKSSVLEREIVVLRQQSAENADKILILQRELDESRSQTDRLTQENSQLSQRAAQLQSTVTKLQRDLQKMLAFRKAIMNSFQDEEMSSAALADVAGIDMPSELGGSSSMAPATTANARGMTPLLSTTRPGVGPFGGATAVAQPVHATTLGGEFGASATLGASRGLGMGAAAGSSAAGAKAPSTSPPPDALGGDALGGSQAMDGRTFFRTVRSRLTYEEFNVFLQNIKRLNSREQSRDDTLAAAKNIFGPQNEDLFQQFYLLLNRHV